MASVASVRTQEENETGGGEGRASAIPTREQAEAMAEVAAMPQPERREADEAVVVEPEVTDPNGEIVKERFMAFLDTL
jgi:hypothetical protein